MYPLIRKVFDAGLEEQKIVLNDEQHDLIDQFIGFYKQKPGPNKSAFVILGGAGSGKTFIINLLRSFLDQQGQKVVMLAPTGRAAKVLSSRSRKFASTIHRYIYSTLESDDGRLSFQLKDNKDKGNCWYFIDEASMVGNNGSGFRSRGLLEELLSFVFDGSSSRRVVFVGDDHQLPPIGSSVSPALDEEYLREKFDLDVIVSRLSEVVRQKAHSPILKLAQNLRSSLSEGDWPKIVLPSGDGLDDVEDPGMAAELYTSLFETDYLEKVVIITYSNNWAYRFNGHIRSLLFETEDILISNDVIMVVKNNYSWGGKAFPFIANGEMAIVKRILSDGPEERYGLKWMDVCIEFIDLNDKVVQIEGKVILDLLLAKDPVLPYEKMKKVYFERQKEFENLSKTAKINALRKDPYMNALQIKYGYAVTGHKSQGGQWKNVIACFEKMYPGMNKMDYIRWSYTVVTRAEENLYLYAFPFL